MARKRSPVLTDAEARLMHVLWNRGRATVADVVAGLRGRPLVAYNTVQTTLRILEDKGYVTHDKVGRAFVYRPLIDQQVARRSALGHLVKRLFDNSPSLLVLNVLEDQQIDATELQRLKRLIEQK
jgi:predicted transcriptional regulator